MNSAGLGPSPRRPSQLTLSGLAGSVPQRLLWCALGLAVVVVMPASLWFARGSAAGAAPALVLFALVSLVAARFAQSFYPHDRLGACNVTTIARAAMVCTLVVPVVTPGALVADPALAWSALAVAALAFALDGVDGFLARRSGLMSAFGARFDMEVDSILALLLAVLVFQNGKVGLWVLLLGLARYLYIAASLVVPWLDKPVRPRFIGKLVCVLQIGVLIVLLAPIIDGPLATALAALALAAVAWSFATDIAWLHKHRS